MDVHKNLEIVVQNMVATADLGGELNLDEVAVAFGLENVEYEPEQFPGLVYRVKEPHVVMLLFGSEKTQRMCQKQWRICQKNLIQWGCFTKPHSFQS